MLLQGLTLPNPHPSSSASLPPPMLRPTLPPCPSVPHVHQDVADTTGTAILRGNVNTAAALSPAAITQPSVEEKKKSARTTEWRHRKAAAAAVAATSSAKSRKEYCCRVCGKSMSGKATLLIIFFKGSTFAQGLDTHSTVVRGTAQRLLEGYLRRTGWHSAKLKPLL